MRISAGFRKRMYARTSLYSVILFFSALPSAGVMSTVALKSRTASYCLVMAATRLFMSTESRGWVVLPPRRVKRRRRTAHEENPSGIRQSRSRPMAARLKSMAPL